MNTNNNNQEGFEELFRKQLFNNITSEGWNTPSDDIFEQALPFIQEKKTRKGVLFLWMIIGVLMIVLFSFYTFSNLRGNTEDINMKVDSILEGEKISFETKLEDANSTMAIQASSKDTKSLEISDQNKTVHTVEKTVEMETQKSVSFLNLRPKETIVVDDHLATAKLLLSNTKKEELAETKKQQLILFDKLLLTPNVIDEKIVELGAIREKYIENAKRKIEVGFLYSPSFNSTVLSNKKALENLSGVDKSVFADGVGLQFNYLLSKNIHLNIGVIFNNLCVRSENTLVIDYDLSTEIVNEEGNIENTLRMEMESPMGDAMGDVVIQNDDGHVLEDDIINSYTTLSHHLSTIEVPLNIAYKHRLNSKLSLIGETGFSYNKSYNDKVEFSVNLMHHNQEMKQEESFMIKYPSFRKSFWKFNIGFGTAYQFNNNISMRLLLNYQRSIFPIIKQNEVDTSLRIINLRTGLFYAF